MGTLSSIGVLSDGAVGSSTQTSFKDDVVSFLSNGFEIGSTILPAGSFVLEEFSNGTVDSIKQNFPSWHGYYIDGLLQSIAKSLDIIPDTGILAPTGIFDPTKPLVVIIVELKELLGQLGEEAIAVLLSQLSVVIQYSEKITAAIEEKDPTAFFDALSETVTEAYAAAGQSSSEIISTLESSREAIETKAREIMFIDIDGNPIEIPEIDVEVPSLSIPALDLSFVIPGVDTAPLFYTVEVQGIDGIGTKFLKMMTVFLSIPSQIASAVRDGLAAVQDIIDAIGLLLTNTIEAIQALFNAILGFVWDLISAALGIAATAFLEISSTINIVIYFVKFFIVSLIGFLLGAGLISYSAAQFLGIL